MPGSKEIDVAAGSKSAVGRAKPPSAWSEVSRFVAAPMSRLGPNVGAVVGFVLIIIVGSLASDVFLSWTNVRNVLLQSAMLGVVSVGMTFVILTGGIDLSVGSVLSFCSVAAAMMFANGQGYPLPVVLLATLAMGTAIGAINGGHHRLARCRPVHRHAGDDGDRPRRRPHHRRRPSDRWHPGDLRLARRR